MDFVAVPTGTAAPAALVLRGPDPDLELAPGDDFIMRHLRCWSSSRGTRWGCKTVHALFRCIQNTFGFLPHRRCRSAGIVATPAGPLARAIACAVAQCGPVAVCLSNGMPTTPRLRHKRHQGVHSERRSDCIYNRPCQHPCSAYACARGERPGSRAPCVLTYYFTTSTTTYRSCELTPE